MSLPTLAAAATVPGGGWFVALAALTVLGAVIWLARHHHPLWTAPLVLLGLVTVGVAGAQGFTPAPVDTAATASSSTGQGTP